MDGTQTKDFILKSDTRSEMRKYLSCTVCLSPTKVC